MHNKYLMSVPLQRNTIIVYILYTENHTKIMILLGVRMAGDISMKDCNYLHQESN